MTETGPLRLGIDARELVGAPTGVGRYLFELADRWRRRDDATRPALVLYVPARARDRERVGELTAGPGVEVREVGGSGGTLWEQIRLPPVANRDRLQVFFAPAYSAPLAVTAPVVVTIHDVSFMAHPEWFRWPGGLRRRALARWSARRAARILTVSEFSASEIRRFLDVAPSKLDVIPSGLSGPERFAGGPRPAREPLALFVGSIFNRRHVPDLVRAFARVARAHDDARLVVAGENRSFPREDPEAIAEELGIADRVLVRSYVTDAELGDLYSRARAFVFLSEYEGFGLTPLEALAHGVPAIVCDTPVAREVCGDAAAYVPCGAPEAVAPALERLLYDDQARAGLLARAPAVLERCSWDRAATTTLSVLTAVASGRGAA